MMHPQQAYLPSYGWQAVPTSRHRSVLDYVRGFSMTIWFLLMVAGFWWQKDYWANIDLEVRGYFFKFSLAGILFVLICHLTLGYRRLLKCPYFFPSSDVKATLLAGFCALMLVASPLSLYPIKSAQYALATWAALCVCYWAWQSDYDTFRRTLVLTGILTLAFLAILVLKHGMIRQSVGGINRNRYATSAFVAIICCFLAKGHVKWLGVLFGFALIVLVNSRGSIISTVVFFGLYCFFTKGLRKAVILGVVLSGVLVLLMSAPSGNRPGGNLIADQIMKLNDKSRGVGTGLSGRLERWEKGLKTFWRKPVLGYGFRSRRNESTESRSAHSGYINLLLDAGILGTALILLAFAYDFFKRLMYINQWKHNYESFPMPENIVESLRLNGMVCALYCVMGALWIIEPLYLNLGTTLSVMFILMISSPITIPISSIHGTQYYSGSLMPVATGSR